MDSKAGGKLRYSLSKLSEMFAFESPCGLKALHLHCPPSDASGLAITTDTMYVSRSQIFLYIEMRPCSLMICGEVCSGMSGRGQCARVMMKKKKLHERR